MVTRCSTFRFLRGDHNVTTLAWSLLNLLLIRSTLITCSCGHLKFWRVDVLLVTCLMFLVVYRLRIKTECKNTLHASVFFSTENITCHNEQGIMLARKQPACTQLFWFRFCVCVCVCVRPSSKSAYHLIQLFMSSLRPEKKGRLRSF